ncbi:MAG: FAD-dependent monooxygenase [Porticoccaceae bacterium]
MSNTHYDIAIVGAGPVGLAAALALAQSPAGKSLKIALIESRPPRQAPTNGKFDTRVVAINESSRRLLDSLSPSSLTAGSLFNSPRVCPYYIMEVWDTAGNGHVRFDCAELHHDNLGHIVEQSVLMAALLDTLASTKNVDFLCPHTVLDIQRTKPETKNQAITLRLDANTLNKSAETIASETTDISADLLIAADGARSQVREHLGFIHHVSDTGHTAIVATIKTEHPHAYSARQWFSTTGPLAFLPLQADAQTNAETGDAQFVSIVWSQQHQRAEHLMALSDQDFCRELELASEHCLGSLQLVSERIKAPLAQSHSDDYVQAGVALLGDAAHAIHPLAGQGVNLGFSDVAALVEELNHSHEKALPINHPSALKRYQRRRKPENRIAETAMTAFKTLFEREELPLAVLRNQGMWVFNKAKGLKHTVIKRAMGLD